MNSSGPRDFWDRDPNPVLRPSGGRQEPGPPPPQGRTAPPAPGPLTHGGAHMAPPTPYTAHPVPGAADLPPGTPPPSGPPPRVGGAVASLVVAFLTWTVPLIGVFMGLWFYVLIANIPGVAFAVTALTKIPNAPDVERFIRYTWACNFAYIALSVVFAVPLVVMVMMMILFGG